MNSSILSSQFTQYQEQEITKIYGKFSTLYGNLSLIFSFCLAVLFLCEALSSNEHQFATMSLAIAAFILLLIGLLLVVMVPKLSSSMRVCEKLLYGGILLFFQIILQICLKFYLEK